MDMLLRIFIFLCISVGFLFVPGRSEACLRNNNCKFVFGNLCFEFVDELKTWSQARSSCEKQGGELLKLTNSSIQVFLNNTTREWSASFNHTWWLGERVGEGNQKPTATENALCTYMKLNPLRFITSDCNQRRSFLCSHSLQSPLNTKCANLSSHTSRSRAKRDVNSILQLNPSDMYQSPFDMLQIPPTSSQNFAGLLLKSPILAPTPSALPPISSAFLQQFLSSLNITTILNLVNQELGWMDITPGQPTNDSATTFISALMVGINLLKTTPALVSNDTANRIINCSSGILKLSLNECPDENPAPPSLFEDVIQVIEAVSVLLAGQGPQSFVLKHPLGTIYQTIQKPSDLGNEFLGSKENGEFVKLPSNSALGPLLSKYSTVITQYITFNENPHPSNDSITGTVCSLSLNDGQNNIKVENLTDLVEIYLARPNAEEVTNTTVVIDQNSRSLTTLNVSDPNMTIFFSVEPSVNVSLVLLLGHGSPPNTTNYYNRTILNYTVGYRWMITPALLQQTPGVWYIDARLYSTWQSELRLKISTFMSKCLYWDTNAQAWSTSGCMVGGESTPYLTQCLCNHLTLFGSSFFVMPNYVDIAHTAQLFATVNQNFVVLSLLCAFFGLYLITLLWACYADRRARTKRKMTFLEDNHPGAQYNYLIGVQTGRRRNAGTSANVTVKLIGSDGESTIHTLTDPDKPVFERGSVDMFLLASPFPLGEVHTIRLQHDNSGGHPSWYINKVTIQDLQTRHLWHFFCDCWLSDNRGDGMTKRTFGAAKTNEIASFRNIFQTRTSTGFQDEHIWVSIVDPPSRSPFTRAQRVSCCMCLLLCTMAINIAFWNVPLDPNSAVLFSMGSIKVTLQEFMVGVQSGLLMFPINILIITIFRSIRPRVVLKSKKDDPEENRRAPAVNIPTVLRDTELIISLMSMSPRNKMSEMHRLESTADLGPALERVNELIQFMQGESESDFHWVYCSKFVLAGLHHLLMCLEKLDGRHFPSPEDYQQVLNFTNVLVRKAEMVFSSHMTYCPPPAKKKRKQTTTILGCWLPWWFVFVGWVMLLSISGISTFFTLLYGFQYGKEKSIKWVMSLGLSLFQSIFILQPLKVLCVAVFFALLLKPVAVEESEEVEQVLLEQRDKCREYCGRDTL